MPVLPEIAPITGPMYQLFVFFMITDPRTVVKGRQRQIMVAILIAIMETLIRFASDKGLPLPTAFNVAPAFLAPYAAAKEIPAKPTESSANSAPSARRCFTGGGRWKSPRLQSSQP